MPTVSVMIPAYNHEKYIAQTIQSVLDQTYQDFEIVIVDDGSSDQTVREIKTFTDNRIRCFCFAENQGACVAVDKCIAEATGKYLAMLSSDDVFLPDKLEKQVAFLDKRQDIGAVLSYAEIIDEQGEPFSQTDHFYCHIFEQSNRSRYEWLNYFFYQGNCLCHPSMLIRRECYEQVGVYDPRYRQLPDFDFWIRLCLHFEIAILPERLLQFRVRADEANASGWTPANQIRDAFERAMALENYLEIESVAELVAIFPQLAEKQIEPDLLPFWIAQEALTSSERNSWLFGLRTLYQLLGDYKRVERLKSICGFSYNDFFELVANYDVFHLFTRHSTRLYIDSGEGFIEQESVVQEQNFICAHYQLCFPISGQFVHAVRWDPLENAFCRVKIDRITYEDCEKVWHTLSNDCLKTNGCQQSDGWIQFVTLDPMITLPIEAAIRQINISGEWELASAENLAAVFSQDQETIAMQNREIENSRQLIMAKADELERIFQSRGWKFVTLIRNLKSRL